MSELDPPQDTVLGDKQNEHSSSPKSQEKSAQVTPKKPRQKRPNYHEIHAKPLPLETYPIPVFIHHNPISYLRIALIILSRLLWSPSSHKIIHNAYFSPETQSIHVTHAASIRALWEHGFFGKGSLSRSEPQWFTAEKRRLGEEASKTSAEVTQSRREERKQFKLERAKAQREAIEEQLRQEGKLDADKSLDELVEDGQMDESPKGTLYTSEAREIVTVHGDSILSAVSESLTNQAPNWATSDSSSKSIRISELCDLEHLQLTPEEAFFLTYALGVLDIVQIHGLDVAAADQPYPAWLLIRLYCVHASFPVPENDMIRLHEAFKSCRDPNKLIPAHSNIPIIEPDNPFILKYVVYHHFRSLGWVVRPGVKFAVDYLLYLRGPAFAHAEFAIMIMPSFSHPHWNNKGKQNNKDWAWLHRVLRVQTQVMKTLVLVYVEVPPPWDSSSSEGNIKIDVGLMLKKYKVRETVVKRWIPSRNRD